MNISVAIDGPAGAGKSSISRRAAKALGYLYVDTGALYRAIGLKLLGRGIGTDLDCDLGKILAETELDIRFTDGEQRIILDGRDVSDQIRTPAASMMASAVSARPEVRAFLLEMQRRLARENNVLMDGRDIGTVVLPDATVKIYLTAPAEIRAKRRYDELLARGEKVSFDRVYEDMVKRDFDDMHRAIAPLKQAEDAVLADTGACNFEESVELVLDIIRRKLDGLKDGAE